MNKDLVGNHFSTLAEKGVWASLYQPGAKVNAENYSFLIRARRVMELVTSSQDRIRNFLDIGCGTAPLGPAVVAMGAHYTGIDFSPAMIDAARRLMEKSIASGAADLMVGDATKPEVPDAAFDSVVAMGLVEYFSRDQLDTAMREIARVLAPGGVAIITIPKRWSWNRLLGTVTAPVRKAISWRPQGADLKLHRKESFIRLYLTPGELDEAARNAGLRKTGQRHYNVQIVSGPFISLGPRFAYQINRHFEWLARIPGASLLATGYVGVYSLCKDVSKAPEVASPGSQHDSAPRS